jgi:hypothetical protein
MKKRIQNSLWRTGVDVRNARWGFPFDFTERDIDPISAFYKVGGHSFFARIPLADCNHLSLLAFKCERASQSPYVRTLVEYANGSCTTYAGSWLEAVHQRFQPRSAAEFMGIEHPSHPELETAPPRGALKPWDQHPPRVRAAIQFAMLAQENRENGTKLGMDAGDKAFGPTSREKGELEFRRLVNVYNSIKKTGPRKNPDGIHNIGALVLVSGGDQKPRFTCEGGNHRMAALAALGHRYVDVQIRTDIFGGIIRRADVDYWATVRAGYLTREEALALFDRLFDSKPPIGFTRAMQGEVNNQTATGRQV